MSALPTILSTKKLTLPQKELLLNGNLGLVEYDAIRIELLEAQNKDEVAHAIFTSKNAVKAILGAKFGIKNCYCVGENTKKLLEENGQKVVEIAQNASELARIIVKKHKNDSFLFFCGNVRRNELPDILKENKVKLKEQIVYRTHAASRIFDRSFDGVLFFSPSGIQSFASRNSLGNSIAFCIGNTTASEANLHTNAICIANKPSIENVIVQAVKYFR